MPSPDDHRSRRTITALSHSKPKPYRRYAYSDEPQRLSRMQVTVLTAGGIVVAGLMLTVAVIAQEHANATRGKAIFAAEAAPAPPQLPAPMPIASRHQAPDMPAAPLPPVLDDASLPIPDPLTPPLRNPVQAHKSERLTLPIPKQAAKTAAKPADRSPTRGTPRPALRAAPAADPDVDLIASILALTPPPAAPPGTRAASACNPAEVLENLCVKVHGMRP